MSEWTFVEGYHDSEKTSIKKIVDAVLGGHDYKFHYEDRKFAGHYDSAGKDAVRIVKDIMESFNSHAPKSRLVFETFETRFVSEEYKER